MSIFKIYSTTLRGKILTVSETIVGKLNLLVLLRLSSILTKGYNCDKYGYNYDKYDNKRSILFYFLIRS